ncbi:MAG: FAD-dependent oxidoreductase [Proteobacteria bacterium]|nr:FAD-dependent oxidoreductase [Pseudomonadota bacterium]
MKPAHQPPLTVAVIGAGIVGVQTARAIQRSGPQVTLFDAEDPGMGTSFGNAGYISTQQIFPLAHGRVLRALPRMLLDSKGPLTIRWGETPFLMSWFLRYLRATSTGSVRRSIEALVALQRRSGAAWNTVLEAEGLSDLMRSNGALKIFETDRGFQEVQEELATQREYGIDWQLLDGPGVHALVPELSPFVRRGVFYPDGMHTVSPYAMTRALFDRFVHAGGVFRQERVGALRPTAQGVVLESPAGSDRFDAVVICAGYLSGQLLRPLGLRVPLVAERGYHLEMSHGALGFDLPVGSHERGFFITPMSSGLRLAGTTEFTSADRDPPPNWRRAEILKEHIRELMPGVTGTETGRWMGRRPTMPDFLPVLGSIPGTPGVYAAFGHQHLGLTLSAVTAEIMAELITQGRSPVDLAPFELARFG